MSRTMKSLNKRYQWPLETSVVKKHKRVMTDKQKENLASGNAIAQKNEKEKAKAKLDEMVDNYLKPYANPETKEEEKAESETMKEETKAPNK